MFGCTLFFVNRYVTAHTGVGMWANLLILPKVPTMNNLLLNDEKNLFIVIVIRCSMKSENGNCMDLKLFGYRSGSDFSPTMMIGWVLGEMTSSRRS